MTLFQVPHTSFVSKKATNVAFMRTSSFYPFDAERQAPCDHSWCSSACGIHALSYVSVRSVDRSASLRHPLFKNKTLNTSVLSSLDPCQQKDAAVAYFTCLSTSSHPRDNCMKRNVEMVDRSHRSIAQPRLHLISYRIPLRLKTCV